MKRLAVVVAAQIAVDDRAFGSSPIRAVPMMWPALLRVAVLDLGRAEPPKISACASRAAAKPALI